MTPVHSSKVAPVAQFSPAPGPVCPPPPFAAEVHRTRRQRALDAIGKNTLVLYSPPEAHRTHDLNYRYRPDSDVHYLTGFAEPETVVVLTNDHKDHKFVMFVRPRDPERETWDGYRAGVEGAKEKYGADEAFPIAEFERRIGDYLNVGTTLYFRFSRDEAFNTRLLNRFREVRRQRARQGPAPEILRDTGSVLGELRLRKDAHEIERMRAAADIAAEAHRQAMRVAAPGRYEFEVEAELEYVFRRRGAMGAAYTSIVGSGPNATILHYNANDRLMKDGDLLLVDAGAEYGYYASDITRTYPVNGKFTDPQRTVYELVLAAQKAALETVTPGRRFNEYHDAALRVLVAGLIDLKLLQESVDEAIEKKTYAKFYMHRTGHWLGGDVHDACGYFTGEEENGMFLYKSFEPGHVVTVEPGLYFAPTLEGVPAEFLGIGVRIEDDVLVTDDGNEILTTAAPKEIAEIEAWMGR
jgi:Xaa-Pro aminopeptidase